MQKRPLHRSAEAEEQGGGNDELDEVVHVTDDTPSAAEDETPQPHDDE